MSDKEFTVHYQDGRVEGPISTKVIRDLVAARVVSLQDYVSYAGGQPVPLASVPEFSDLAGGGAPAGLRPAPGGLPPRPGGLPSMPGGAMGGDSSMEDSTVMMQIPEGGFHPLAIQAEIEARKAAVARKKAEASQPTSGESEDLFAAAPAVTRTPLKTGASYQSSSNLAQGSISIKNPFSGRQKARGGAPAIQDDGWSEATIRLTAKELRDKLLSLPVHEVLDLDVHCEPEQAQAAYESRHRQIQEHPDAKGSSMIARAAIEDLLNIIEKCRDVLCDRDQALTYIARVAEEGTDIPFNKYVSFQLAAIKPITGPIAGPSSMPGQSSTPASAGIKSGNFKANLPSSSVLEDVAKPGASPFTSGSHANPFTSGN
ncbi:MAG: hypothetical protein CMH57_09350, partial [Myxococcales bacterium]|nr:hypothetical protein [Myxococcales bacterium]